MFIKCTAEVIGNIVFTIREGTGTAETAHDRTGFAFNTGFYFLAIDGTMTFVQRISLFENRDF